MEENKNIPTENTFLHGSILSPLVKFSLPLILSLLLQALYGGVDLAVVGHFSLTSSVSAVATGSQVMQSATVIVTGLTMGVTVLLGKAIGAGNYKTAGDIVAGQIKFFSFVALALTVIMISLAPQAVALMNVPDKAVPETIEYIRICSGGMVFITAYNAISGVFRGIGNSRSPFLFVLIACIVNILLDLLFVGVFNMASSGAALATVIAQAVSVVFSVLYIKRKPLPFAITRDNFNAEKQIGKIVKIGSPIALQDLLVNISFLIITSIVNSLGLVASAGIGVSEKLFLFLSIVPMAFMSALSAFVAQNMGAAQPQRAVRSLWIAQGISYCFGIVIFLLTFFAGSIPASLFDNDPEVIAATAEYLHGSSFEYLMIPLTFCFLGYFNGREHTAFVMIQGFLSAFLVRVPLSYVLSRLPETNMFTISLAVPISGLVNLLLCLFYFIYLRRKDKKSSFILS
jgi:putative MATE family efflux protein